MLIWGRNWLIHFTRDVPEVPPTVQVRSIGYVIVYLERMTWSPADYILYIQQSISTDITYRIVVLPD